MVLLAGSWKEGSMLVSGAVAAAANGASLSGGATTTNSYSHLEKLLAAPLGNLSPC